MILAVVVATRNRSTLLAAALGSLLEQRLAGEVEIVVADNGSTDDTAAVVEAVAAKASRPIRYLFAPETGKSYALNAAIAASRADLLAFFDDDQLADPNWLAVLVDALARHPEAAAVGGRYAAWEADIGRFWRRALLAPYLVDQGPVERRTEWLAGGNMLARREALLRVDGFSVEFTESQDVRLCHDLIGAGYEVWYVPGAVIYHRLHGDRLTLRGWRRQVRQHGTAMARVVPEGEEASAVRGWRRSRRRELLRLPYAVLLQGATGAFHQLDWFLRCGDAIRWARARAAARTPHRYNAGRCRRRSS